MSIIQNYSTPGTYSFEHSIDEVYYGLSTGMNPIHVDTEYGAVLIETDVTGGNRKPFDFYRWGNEPKTSITAEWRHHPLDYYVKVHFPTMWKVRSGVTLQRLTIAIMIVGNLFLDKIVSKRYSFDQWPYLDAIVTAYDRSTMCRRSVDLIDVVALEHRADLYSINANCRKLTMQLVRSIAAQRKEAVSKLMDRGAALLADCKGGVPMCLQLDNFWNKMLFIGAVAREDESLGHNYGPESSDAGISKFFEENPEANMSQGKAIIAMLCSDIFKHPRPTTTDTPIHDVVQDILSSRRRYKKSGKIQGDVTDQKVRELFGVIETQEEFQHMFKLMGSDSGVEHAGEIIARAKAELIELGIDPEERPEEDPLDTKEKKLRKIIELEEKVVDIYRELGFDAHAEDIDASVEIAKEILTKMIFSGELCSAGDAGPEECLGEEDDEDGDDY